VFWVCQQLAGMVLDGLGELIEAAALLGAGYRSVAGFGLAGLSFRVTSYSCLGLCIMRLLHFVK
jgi:hypothetical protein